MPDRWRLKREYEDGCVPCERPCPRCGGIARHLGILGKLRWFRCRACGWEFSEEVKT